MSNIAVVFSPDVSRLHYRSVLLSSFVLLLLVRNVSPVSQFPNLSTPHKKAKMNSIHFIRSFTFV